MLSLIGLPFIGHAAKNAVSWYKIGPVTIQPSEFAKVGIILYLSIYYERNKDKLDNQWNIIKPIIVALIIVGLVMIQPDMGTAVIIGLITIIMFYGVPIDKKKIEVFF
ncbi:MAG: FtsW/RodA/SpoVE family cell cycle protein [Bacilli bacterium]|nr:MAG: FtsW/RodA/SpoVE family cell cycle protein [Bacilli bacterium]